ncbi:MAG: GntR family transcriptional regulator [Propionibacteriaceae bacterium]|nr:GntR family transcriptional regulator [Propionibacteriaceae bacterium]
MQWEFTNDRAISLQIVEIVQKGILSGVYPPGSSLPSVRVLAVEAGVNPNTMQKALVELEARGLVHTQRNSGRTVTDDERLIMKLKQQAAASYVEQFFADMRNLGFERADAAAILKSQATSPLEEVG